jgi:hypothetical protein
LENGALRDTREKNLLDPIELNFLDSCGMWHVAQLRLSLK